MDIKNFKSCGHRGFTLAEVLITLGVIGIVAAITIPTLITKYQKMVFATKAKQTYSILSSALITSVAENGPMSEWNFGKSSNKTTQASEEDLTYIANTYFKPYFKIAKDIGYGGKDAENYSIILSNGMTLSFFTDGNIKAGIYTPSSIYIVVSNNRNTQYYADKSRDYSKHDMFFVIHKTIYPFAWDKKGANCFEYTCISSRDDLINQAMYGCNENISPEKRYSCTALLMYDGWEIKDDYPW